LIIVTFRLITIVARIAVIGMSVSAYAAELNPRLAKYAAARHAEFDEIPAERQRELKELAAYIQSKVDANAPVRLTFICTHNSRRSHIAQLWAAVAAERFHISGIETFSGGTEATAFNPRAAASLERAGFDIERGVVDAANPRYLVSYAADRQPLECYSKVYTERPNPQGDYVAVMVCSQADEACPVVAGAVIRFAIPYDDPKAADGSPSEAAAYDERCAQIAREMLFAFSQVRRAPPHP
jgi:protein-tyrosine-phosphatase